MNETIRPIKVGIDKLRFGSDKFGPKSRRATLRYCDDLVKDKIARPCVSIGKTHEHSYSITVKEGVTMYVALSPFREDGVHPKFVVDLNPNKFGTEGMKDALVHLQGMLGTRYKSVMEEARITMVDYFADYPVKVQDIFIEMPRKEICAIWGIQFGPKFIPQTYYFGGGGTDGQLRAYDKIAEAIAATAKAGRDGKIDTVTDASGRPLGSRMRLEARRLPKATPLSELQTLPNPFERVSLAKIGDDASEFQTPLGRTLLDSARANGWQIAVRRLGDEKLQRQYQRAFRKHLCYWWNPDEAAVDVAVAVLRTGLFPAEAFNEKVRRRTRATKDMEWVAFDRAQLTAHRKALKAEKAASRKPDTHLFGLDDEDEDE